MSNSPYTDILLKAIGLTNKHQAVTLVMINAQLIYKMPAYLLISHYIPDSELHFHMLEQVIYQFTHHEYVNFVNNYSDNNLIIIYIVNCCTGYSIEYLNISQYIYIYIYKQTTYITESDISDQNI